MSLVGELLCSAVYTISNELTTTEFNVDDGWDYLMMPDPIAGDTSDIESMYNSN